MEDESRSLTRSTQQSLKRQAEYEAQSRAGSYIIEALDDNSSPEQKRILSREIVRILLPLSNSACEAFARALTSDPETLRNTRFRRRLVPGDVVQFKRRGELAKMRLKHSGYFTLAEVTEICSSLGIDLDRFILADEKEGLYVFKRKG